MITLIQEENKVSLASIRYYLSIFHSYIKV